MEKTKETRENKHVVIGNSINNLKMARNGLRGLYDKITLQDKSPEEEKSVEAKPGLSEFLTISGAEIDNITADLNKIRDDLHETLF